MIADGIGEQKEYSRLCEPFHSLLLSIEPKNTYHRGGMPVYATMTTLDQGCTDNYALATVLARVLMGFTNDRSAVLRNVAIRVGVYHRRKFLRYGNYAWIHRKHRKNVFREVRTKVC